MIPSFLYNKYVGKSIFVRSNNHIKKGLSIFSTLFFMFVFSATIYAQETNMVSMDSWVAGTSGEALPYKLQGTASQSSRITMSGPHGDQVVVWQAAADGSSGMNGGFSHTGVVLETSKTYRFSFWMQSSGPNGCTNYAGYTPYETNGTLINSSQRIDGTTTNWPYFYNANLPNDTWYLIVGYMGPSGFSGGPDSGVYDSSDFDPNTPDVLPAPVFSATDWVFPNTANNQVDIRIRNFMWNCAPNEFLFSYEPRIEEFDGSEKPLTSIFSGSDPNAGNGNTGGSSVWNTSGTDVYYNGGNVGIGTNTLPNGYRLAVDGKIIGEEIKVQLSGQWPDYVFTDDYKLLSLETLEEFIMDNGHLPNIPSANEVKTNGIELGEMSRLLLEKIEELTLYTLEQDKAIRELKKTQDLGRALDKTVQNLE